MKVIFEELAKKDIYLHILTSLRNVVTGFVFAFIIAIIIIFVLYEVKWLDRVIYPIVELLRPIPNAGWVPIAILICASLEQSIIFITFVGAFFPIFITIYRSIKDIPEHYLNLGKLYKFKKMAKYRFIIIPAILPHMCTAGMLGVAGGWLSVIMAEMISGKSGIGYYTWKNYTLLNYELVVLGVVIMGILGSLFSLLFSLLSKKVGFWMRRKDNA